MQKQRQLISEVKLRIRGIGKQIADLKREKYILEQLIMQDAYITAQRKKNLNLKLITRLKHGQGHKNNLLKAAINGIRDN
jgi:hypothetical protein